MHARRSAPWGLLAIGTLVLGFAAGAVAGSWGLLLAASGAVDGPGYFRIEDAALDIWTAAALAGAAGLALTAAGLLRLRRAARGTAR